ncbi:Phosphatidylcholine-sterol acyltransferase [Fragariocoptes setiger]|uniref:Phosphatidylcholine-sterol acyltransferase n=1 Tax=Fragariocoptes setiger TaxID=1670756 RepID=A0ABQ7S5K7_9ACAR|nr:Phosphatidylcholine-sterol acyltransferase [Fragariocoptes setiger]
MTLSRIGVTFISCCLFLGLERVSAISQNTSPVIFVPGDGGSQMDAKLNKTDHIRYICSYQSDWFDIWLNLRLLLPVEIDCFIDNMKLSYNETTHQAENTPGVTVRPHNFGSLDSVDYLDNARLHGTDYFSSIINEIESYNNYKRNVNMVGAPYDFRLAPNQLSEFFANLTQLIEQTFYNNHEQRVTLICHSMGCLNSVYLLNNRPREWKDKFVRRIITIAAPWAGSVKALNAMMFGDNLGVFLLSSVKLHIAQRTLPSLTYLFPVAPVFANDRVLIESSDKNYTLLDMKKFFTDINHPHGYMMWQDTKVYTENLRAPDVEMWCLYGLGIPTISKLKFNGTLPDSEHIEIMGDGDGTVNLESLRACQKWDAEQTYGVYHHEFPVFERQSIFVRMADGVNKQFEKAAEDLKKLKSRPVDEELLEVYALYKQATVGDCEIPKPGIIAFKEKAKWESWNKKKGMDQEEAKLSYIHRVNTLIETYGINE